MEKGETQTKEKKKIWGREWVFKLSEGEVWLRVPGRRVKGESSP